METVQLTNNTISVHFTLVKFFGPSGVFIFNPGNHQVLLDKIF